MPNIIAVCISKEKGTKKEMIREGFLKKNYGLIGDAHAGSNRQVSLLALESIQKLGLDVGPGEFAENLTTKGIDLVSLPIGTWLSIGNEVILEISEIGKECHTGCAIYYETGKCIMPNEGIFAKVVRGGKVKPGDEIKVVE